MTTPSEIVTKEIKLKTLLSEPLKALIARSEFKFQIVNGEEYELLEEMDLLIEQVFPSGEAEEYKPSQILYEENDPLCIACLKNGIVQGCMAANFDLENNSVTLLSLAVDKQYRNQKLGSMFMLALHDLCCELDITNISLISSNAGKTFYESFGFKPMAHNSYEATIPFEQSIIARKTFNTSSSTQEKMADPAITNKKRVHQCLLNSSIFKPVETQDNIEKKNETRPFKKKKSQSPSLKYSFPQDKNTTKRY